MSQSSNTSSRSPLSWLLPAKPACLDELKKLLTNSRSSIELQSRCALKDPVIALELIKAGNTFVIAGNKTILTTVYGCIQRLGNAEILERLEDIARREPIDTPGVTEWIEIYRDYSKQLSLVTGIVAEIKLTPYVEECRTASLFTFLGDMLAAAFLREEYVVNAHSCTRKVLNYRLAQKYHLDPEQTLIKYLQKHSIPELIIFPLDRKAVTKDPRGAAIRPICTAAQELYEARQNDKWERYKDPTKLPSSSMVRVLQLPDPAYARMIDRLEELFSSF